MNQFKPYSYKKLRKFYTTIWHWIVADTVTLVPSSTLAVMGSFLYSEFIWLESEKYIKYFLFGNT